MSPARAAVLGHVLVTNVSQEVSSVNVVPDPGVRDIIDGNERLLDLGNGDLGKRETAWTVRVSDSWLGEGTT